MATSNGKIKLFQAHSDSSIAAIARTVNAAFSSDPLIQWLRPTAQPWARQNSDVVKWQYRRVQSIMAHGVVLQSSNVSQMAHENPRKGEEAKTSPSSDDTSGKSAQVSLYEEQAAYLVEEDAGAVVFLFPPPKELAWSFARTLLKCKIWLLDLLNPVHDEECNMKRVDLLMSSHTKSLSSLQRQYKQGLWYLEVIAVHPSLQSRGIGRNVMNGVLDNIHNQPVYLECTQQGNIGFYESFGFRVIEEVELTDEESNNESATVKYWAMIRADEGSSN